MQRAFYLFAPGSWRDYFNLLHLPYTIWHLSYVVLGAALVPDPNYSMLGLTLLAFFLALGIGAHALDELRGRPLGTTIATPILWTLGIVATTSAAAIGIVVGRSANPLLLPFVAAGVLLVFAYNLEWGPFHHDVIFALAWGAFPVLTSYLAQSGSLSAGSLVIAAAAAAISSVQRTLSTRVRYLRRKVVKAEGRIMEIGGTETSVSREWLIQDHERVLTLMSVVMPAIAIGLLLR